MIKAVIADVDGVMVGKKHGVNFPLPNEKVIKRLKEIHQNGLPIVLCSAKYHPGIIEIIKKAELRNPHITSGGALIIDPLDDKIIRKHTLDNKLAKNIVSTCLDNGVYIECYGTNTYFIQNDQISELSKKHAIINHIQPRIVRSLQIKLVDTDIIKIEAFAKDKGDITRIDSLLKKFSDDINTIWTMHPTILPYQICVIIKKGVSKRAASIEVLEYLKISSDETLAIGDTFGDWNFMEICKYVAMVGEESSELKDAVKTKGEGNYFFAPSVDDDGILDIFSYFNVR